MLEFIGLLFALVLLIVLQGCSITSMVVATVEDFNEVLVGQAHAKLMMGGTEFSVEGINTKLVCQGVVLRPYAVANNLSLSCAGMVGRGNAKCSDGRAVEFKWVADSCSRYHGDGKDSVGNAFHFEAGLDEAKAEKYIQQKLMEAANRPGLPVYSSAASGKAQGLFTGTGFYVTNNGIMVTSYHVVEGAEAIHVVDAENGRKLPASVLATDPGNDIAVITTGKKSEAIPLAGHFSAAPGDEVLTLGYPLPSKPVQDQKVTFGRIYSLSGPEDDNRMVQTDVPIQLGNAGSPLLNGDGEVIGMITTSLDEILLSRATGSLPPNINLAIKIDHIIPVLRAAQAQAQAIQAPDTDPSAMNLLRIVKLRKSSVGLVIAE